MIKNLKDTFTKIISAGWWGSLIVLIAESLLIDCAPFAAVPWVGLILFGIFLILSFTPLFDRQHKYSPYKPIYEAIKSLKN